MSYLYIYRDTNIRILCRDRYFPGELIRTDKSNLLKTYQFWLLKLTTTYYFQPLRNPKVLHLAKPHIKLVIKGSIQQLAKANIEHLNCHRNVA